MNINLRLLIGELRGQDFSEEKVLGFDVTTFTDGRGVKYAAKRDGTLFKQSKTGEWDIPRYSKKTSLGDYYNVSFAVHTENGEVRTQSFSRHELIMCVFNRLGVLDALEQSERTGEHVEINHKNNDSHDTHIDNLELCTPEENRQHGRAIRALARYGLAGAYYTCQGKRVVAKVHGDGIPAAAVMDFLRKGRGVWRKRDCIEFAQYLQNYVWNR